ncbi:MAG TPA: peptidoglycan-binding domain-containing protein [Candidatus Udaeobacter sp.]
MRTFFVLICMLALVCTVRGGKQQDKATTHANTSQRVPTKSPQHVPVKSSQHVATHAEHPATSNAHVQHPQPIQRTGTVGHPPKDGNRTGPPGLERDTKTTASGVAAAKPAAPVPPTPVYHYNFRTKSGLIGRDFTRPLTPDEQSAIARQVENGQREKTKGAFGSYDSENSVYHYNFRTKSGLIGQDFTRPLTPQEQATIGRQIENGQPAGIQAPPGGAPVSEHIGASAAAAREAEIEDAKKRGAIITDRATKLAPPPAQGNVTPFRPQHFDLPSKPDPAIASVKFQGTGHIQGSEAWTGQKYTVFRNYHHEWHDMDWWRHHHHRVILISGGWYIRNARYWYPAWGYDSGGSYYPYDGPIYAYSDLPPDQVIANMQAALQAQGYYNGSINGILDAATQAAVAQYQQDHGLAATSAVDEPTLESLGFA